MDNPETIQTEAKVVMNGPEKGIITTEKLTTLRVYKNNASD